MTRIVAVAYGTDNTSVVTTSDTDGMIWTTRTTPLDGGLMRDVIHDTASAQFIAVGASPDYTGERTSGPWAPALGPSPVPPVAAGGLWNIGKRRT